MLKALFGFAFENKYDSMLVTAYPKYQALIGLLKDFGFVEEPQTRPTGETALVKHVGHGIVECPSVDPLQYHVSRGPHAIDILGAPLCVVPIQPRFHEMLFPEMEEQGSLLAGQEAFGNTIKKAYLCHAPLRTVEPGATLLFYRSEDRQAITCWGVVETAVRSSEPDELCGFVLPRTVYTEGDIDAMCRRGSVLAIMFRQCLMPIRPSIGLEELTRAGVLKGAPQTIVRIKEDSKEWIAQRLSRPS